MCIRDRNSRGPNTIPCGTPESREVASEEVPSITTVIFVKFHVLGVYLGFLLWNLTFSPCWPFCRPFWIFFIYAQIWSYRMSNEASWRDKDTGISFVEIGIKLQQWLRAVFFADPEITAGCHGRVFRVIIKQITQMNSACQDLLFAANFVKIGQNCGS